jgi:hypothetical protein
MGAGQAMHKKWINRINIDTLLLSSSSVWLDVLSSKAGGITLFSKKNRAMAGITENCIKLILYNCVWRSGSCGLKMDTCKMLDTTDDAFKIPGYSDERPVHCSSSCPYNSPVRTRGFNRARYLGYIFLVSILCFKIRAVLYHEVFAVFPKNWSD